MLQTRVGTAAPTAALVKQDDAIAGRVKKPPRLSTAAAPGAAMQKNHRLAFGVSRLLIINSMAARHLDFANRIGLHRRVQPAVS